jgi:hypothetical protein
VSAGGSQQKVWFFHNILAPWFQGIGTQAGKPRPSPADLAHGQAAVGHAKGKAGGWACAIGFAPTATKGRTQDLRFLRFLRFFTKPRVSESENKLVSLGMENKRRKRRKRKLRGSRYLPHGFFAQRSARYVRQAPIWLKWY